MSTDFLSDNADGGGNFDDTLATGTNLFIFIYFCDNGCSTHSMNIMRCDFQFFPLADPKFYLNSTFISSTNYNRINNQTAFYSRKIVHQKSIE